jgi:flagellar hook-length control protein FliK
LSQALPVLPQLPVLDGRKPDLRPVDAGNRQTFGKLLDRFTQRDVAKDTAKEPTRDPAMEKRAETAAEADASPEDGEAARSCDVVSETDAARETPEPTELAVVVPTVMPVPAELPVIVTPAGESPTAVPVVSSGELPAEPSIVAAVVPSMPQQPVGADAPTTTGTAAPIVGSVEPEAIAMAAQPTAESTAPVLGMNAAAMPVMPAPVVRIANPGPKPAATTGEQTAVTDPADAALPRAPLAKTAAAPVEPTDLSRQILPDGKPKTAPSGMAADPVAGTIRDERATAAKTPEQQFGALIAVDTPRSAAAQYHKVAETVRTAAAETPSPADQVSIRLLHAVAEGKRTIQMHLHPAELGTIDVKMQWQGDRLTAQFQVDRPETLQLLQREVPALERTLNQAGVNVDSGSLSFSLRQHTGNGQNGNGQLFDPAAGAAFGEAADLPLGDEPLGQVIRDGLLSIRV